jgi:hypothetical protein
MSPADGVIGMREPTCVGKNISPWTNAARFQYLERTLKTTAAEVYNKGAYMQVTFYSS